MHKKFATASLLTDVGSKVILYIIYALLFLLADKIGAVGLVVFVAVGAVIGLATKTDRSMIENTVARAVLGVVAAPAFLSARLRPYTWTFVSTILLQSLKVEELEELYNTLAPISEQAERLHADPKWKDRDFDFLEIKDEVVFGCHTWGEAEDLFENGDSALSEKRK